LDQLLGNQKLDFFAISSSLASLFGGFGQVDYCAANNFLDAYAQARSSERCPYLSINWDTWREVGMAVNTEVPTEMEASRALSLQRGITPEEGAEAFLWAFQCGTSQVAISTTDLQVALEGVPTLTAETIAQQSAPAATARAAHPRPALVTPYVAPRTESEEVLSNIWQELLGVAPVGIFDNFFELGGHSLLAIQLTSQLKTLLDIEISVQRMFDAPTIAKLGEQVDALREKSSELQAMAELLDQVEQLSDAEVQTILKDRDLQPGLTSVNAAGQGNGI